MSFSKSIHIKNCGKVKKKTTIIPSRRNFFQNMGYLVGILLLIGAVSNLGFWFKVKVAVRFPHVAGLPAVLFPGCGSQPEQYGSVFRGLKPNAQRRDWAKRQFRNSPYGVGAILFSTFPDASMRYTRKPFLSAASVISLKRTA